MSTLFILLLFLLGCYLAAALFLWIGAKWARVPGVTFLWALVATLAIGLLSFVVQLGFRWLWSTVSVPPLLAWGIEAGAVLLVAGLTLKVLFRTSLPRAIASWLPTLVPGAATLALIYLVLGPYVLAPYIMPTHSMPPTLLGPHQRGICPHCGQSATVSFHPEVDDPAKRSRLGMCDSCQQAGMVTNIAPTVYPADRFLVNRLLKPRRWDLVVFRTLQDPSVRYVKRLVGLPGEEVAIKDGAIWINGAKPAPPSEIAKLTFTTTPGRADDEEGAPAEYRLRLGPDEHFVLGDFSQRSYDSRAWGPLPGKNLEGVVSIVYWPPSRWRLVR